MDIAQSEFISEENKVSQKVKKVVLLLKSNHTDIELQHFYAQIADVRLHWVEMGSKKNTSPPIVLIHGLNDSYLTWIRIATVLAKNRRVLIPDLPGHGLSERPDASYALCWHAQILIKWIEMLGIEKVDLAGHSFGGGVAQMILRDCHHRVRKLILLSSGGLGREVAFELRLASLTWAVEKLGQPFMALGTFLALWKIRRHLPKEHISDLTAMNRQKGSARAFARTVNDVINWRGQYRTFFQHIHELPNLPPIALFWGVRDRIIPAEHARKAEKSIQGVLITLFAECGHHLHHEKPQLVGEAFRDFLDAPS